MKLSRLITRRRLKWVGFAAVTATVATAVYSMRFERIRPSQWPSPYSSSVRLEFGSVQVHWVRQVRGAVGLKTILQTRSGGRDWSVLFVPKLKRYTLGYRSDSDESSLSVDIRVPLGSLAILFAIPTAWLWHTDRRAKPWQCATCRYDLRGLNVRSKSGPTKGNGVCPECGTPTERNT